LLSIGWDLYRETFTVALADAVSNDNVAVFCLSMTRVSKKNCLPPPGKPSGRYKI
jgi:hypothetical protein